MAAAIGAGVLCLLLLLRAAFSAPSRIPLNYNEGWNAYHAADFQAGRALYPAGQTLFPNTYPPLSFVVVSAVAFVGSDVLVTGRVVALVAFAAWVSSLFVAARRLECTWLEAVCGAAVFAGWMLVRHDDYIGVDDPQVLGHAVQSVALTALLGPRQRPAMLVVTGLLMATGVFLKHNLLALPGAATVALLFTDRRAAGWLIGGAAIGGLTLAAVAVVAFGPGLGSIFAARGWIPGKLTEMFGAWLPAWVPAGVLALLLSRNRRDPRVILILAYALLGVLAGTLILGGDGIYWNALFDAEWALTLTAVVAWNRLSRNAPWQRSVAIACCVLPLVIAVSVKANRHWLSRRFVTDPHWYEVSTAAREIAFLEGRRGPVLCENLTLCFWAAKPPEVDFFDLQQRVRRDPSRADALAERIERREFAVLLLDGPLPQRSPGPRTMAAISRNYRLDHQSQWGAFLVPTGGPF